MTPLIHPGPISKTKKSPRSNLAINAGGEETMTTLQNSDPKIQVTLSASQVTDILSGLCLLSRYRVGEPAQRTTELSDILWREFLSQLGKGRAQ
ncbi:MAG: hypothetical protein A2992_06790 [Elusimicrobia bacterium RIFCSPLOWO2_01_FULL_59_12]|nr:MAG: hypothetical protein A2992_06790 [Elusimicrobia bacterium RIFCSPLOWO2_01_FULL_59_12]